jgi:hypothetical protein
MRRRETSGAILNLNLHILHHALILVVKDVTMQHELADIALIARADLDGVHRGREFAREISPIFDQILDPERVLPDAFQSGILRIDRAAVS